MGRNAAEWLCENGHTVRAVGRNLKAGAELGALGAVFTALDLTRARDGDLDRLVEKADWVWHCAALSSPWGKRTDFEHCNALLSDRLAQAAGRAGVQRFVHISTPSIYFDFKHRKNIEENFRAGRFANNYARTKFAAEGSIRSAQQAFPGTLYIMLRPRSIFGPHDQVILPRVLQQLEAGKGWLRLPRGGRALVDLTFAPNVVHAMVLASTQESLPPGAVYNITNQEPGRLADILTQLLQNEMGLQLRIKALPYPLLYIVAAGMEASAIVTGKEPALTRYSVGALHFDITLSSEKARSELGYAPVYTLREGLSLTAQWLKNKTAASTANGGPANG